MASAVAAARSTKMISIAACAAIQISHVLEAQDQLCKVDTPFLFISAICWAYVSQNMTLAPASDHELLVSDDIPMRSGTSIPTAAAVPCCAKHCTINKAAHYCIVLVHYTPSGVCPKLTGGIMRLSVTLGQSLKPLQRSLPIMAHPKGSFDWQSLLVAQLML